MNERDPEDVVSEGSEPRGDAAQEGEDKKGAGEPESPKDDDTGE